jgi:hypothetical protein
MPSRGNAPAGVHRRETRGGLSGLFCLGILSFALTSGGCSRPFVPAPPVVEPGPMPAGGEWRGVYASKTHGDLHVLITDGRADGAWRTPDGVYGELWGEVLGNEIRYMWREVRKDAQGRRIAWFGRGYFVYTVRNGEPDEISGQWGLEWREAGEEWSAVKKPGLQPNLDAVRSLGGDDAEGDDYDSDFGGMCTAGCDSEEEY